MMTFSDGLKHMTMRIHMMTGLLPPKGFLTILFIAMLLGGCGNKGFPIPMTGAPPPQVKDLQAQVRSRTVEVSWSLPEQFKDTPKEKDPDYLFLILKTEPKWENRNCLDCPTPTEQEMQTINPSRPEPARREGNKLVWTDKAVAPQHAYRYKISIIDARKRSISVSNPAMVKVVSPPAALKSLTAATQPKGILLQWKPPGKDDQGLALQGDLFFLVERTSPGGAWEKLSNVLIRGNSFLDSAVASNQVYSYRVTPYLNYEETTILGEPSTFQQAKAPHSLPPPPPNKVWVIPAKGAMEVHWTQSEGSVGGYHVYRREGKEIIRLTEAPIQRAPYVDRAVKRNVVYHYAVSAVGIQPDQQEGLLSKWAEIRSLMFE